MFSRLQVRPAHRNRPRVQRHLSVLCALVFGANMVYAQAGGMTLEDALRLSSQRSTLPKASEASVQASREAAARAGQLPDPMLKLGVENLPVEGAERWSTTRESMTMRRVAVEQQWVSADKRAARTNRARRATEAEEGSFLADLAKVREETAKAWVAVLYAQRSLALVKAVEQQIAQDLMAVEASHRGAKASAGDVVQAQLALTQAQDAVRKSEQELKIAKLALARWTTVPVEAVADQAPSLVSHVSNLPVEDLEKYHPMVLVARQAVALADAETTVATRERNPDWSFEAGFSQRAQYSNTVSVGVSIPLPVNRAHRQDRDVAERAAMGTKARLQYEDAVRETQTEIQTLSSTLESLKDRLAHLNAQLLPAARQQAELATAAYRAGTGSLSSVFGARKMLLEQQLQLTELEKEAAFTWAKLEYRILPHGLASPVRVEQ